MQGNWTKYFINFFPKYIFMNLILIIKLLIAHILRVSKVLTNSIEKKMRMRKYYFCKIQNRHNQLLIAVVALILKRLSK